MGGDLGYDRIGQTYNDFELYIYMIINFECWMMDDGFEYLVPNVNYLFFSRDVFIILVNNLTID